MSRGIIRDKDIYSQAGRLIEVTNRRARLGKMDDTQRHFRLVRIALAHYRDQRRAGSPDYADASV